MTRSTESPSSSTTPRPVNLCSYSSASACHQRFTGHKRPLCTEVMFRTIPNSGTNVIPTISTAGLEEKGYSRVKGADSSSLSSDVHTDLILHLDLEDTVYEELQEKRGVRIRSLATMQNLMLPYEGQSTPASDLSIPHLPPECSHNLEPTSSVVIPSHTHSHEASISVTDVGIEFCIANFISRIRTQALMARLWCIGHRREVLCTHIAVLRQGIQNQFLFAFERAKLVLVATTLIFLHPILVLLKRVFDGDLD